VNLIGMWKTTNQYAVTETALWEPHKNNTRSHLNSCKLCQKEIHVLLLCVDAEKDLKGSIYIALMFLGN